MLTVEIMRELAWTIRHAAELQARLIGASVTTKADHDALEHDLKELRASVDAAIHAVLQERAALS